MPRTLLVLLLLTIIPGSSGTVLGADGGVIRSYALVQDDATLRVRGKTIRLFGLYIPPTERGCATVFRPPACGSRTVRALELKIRGFVECLPQLVH